MQPVLFTVANQPISSFGLFLILAFIVPLLVIWRITRIYELDEERVLDISLLTFTGGLIFARFYYILFHQAQFDLLIKIFLINRYPGLSFWGGLFGGFLTLWFFSRRLRLNFWQVADFAAVGLFLGSVFGSIGCLFGSCQYGMPSNLPIAVTQAGILEKRFPLQVVEGLLFLAGFFYLWRLALRFHATGLVASRAMVFLGIGKLFLEFFRGDRQDIIGGLSVGILFSVLLIVYGVSTYYSTSKKSFSKDIYFLFLLLISRQKREIFVSRFKKNWYNFFINSKIGFLRWKRRILRSVNIKSNPDKLT